MRTVEDRDGRRYLLLKRAADAVLVHDLETGEQSYQPTASVRTVAGEDVLRTAGSAAPPALRAAVPAPPTRGLLVLLAAESEMSVRELLTRVEHCESEIYAMLRELELADLIAYHDRPTGGRYTVTEAGHALLSEPHS